MSLTSTSTAEKHAQSIAMKRPVLHPRYITNKGGRKTAVILSVNEFDELMEDLDDLAVIAERRDEPLLSHQQAVAELKRHGRL